MILIIKHIEIEGPGTIGEFFKNANRAVRTIELNKDEGLPESLSDIEAIVVLGGPMNVYEEKKFPFLKKENAFLKKAMKDNIPTLGICLGAQLLAKACGANVGKSPEKEIGWYKVNITKEGAKDPLFTSLDKELNVFQWHEDTFEIPSKGVLLATSRHCNNQAVRFSKNVYGLQFHIEVTCDMIRDWAVEYIKGPDSRSRLKGKQMVADYAKLKNKFNKQANAVYSNFESLI